MTGNLVRVSDEDFSRAVAEFEVKLPIEQSLLWNQFDLATATRKPWGRFLYYQGATLRAVISFSRYTVRHFPYLWAKHGPVWVGGAPTPSEETELAEALRRAVAKADKSIVFMRLHSVTAQATYPILQTITYDQTIQVDLTPSEDEILADMRQTGRRNIRKALKNEGLQIQEETGLTYPQFQELYKLLEVTGQRDGFGIYPARVYYQMLESLAPHCRIFVARNGETPVAWAIVTVYDGLGVYYYGASNREGHKLFAADLLHWRIMQTLKAEGVAAYDFMGIGSEIAPELKGVTQFKQKFAPGPTAVAPARDVPVKPLLYRGLRQALRMKRKLTSLRAGRGEEEAAAPDAPVQPWKHALATSPGGKPFRLLIVGADIGGMSIARTFNENYHARALVFTAAPFPFAVGVRGAEIYQTNSVHDDAKLRQKVNEVAALHDSPLLVLTCIDSYLHRLSAVREKLADNVKMAMPSHEMITKLANKANFMDYCRKYNVPHPDGVVVQVSHGAEIPDLSALDFPLIAKPGNVEHSEMSFPGKLKLYRVRSQQQAQQIVDFLADAKYRGNVVFQRYVVGDDAKKRVFTCYINEKGEMTLRAFGKVLLEEHTPELIGNSATILTRPGRDLCKQVTDMMQEVGWRGYANFDMKIDSRDGTLYFFEINPRLGRSNYYLNVGGINPLANVVADLIDANSLPIEEGMITRRGIYTVVPLLLTRRYLRPKDRREIWQAIRKLRVKNPLFSIRELHPAHVGLQVLLALKQFRYFHRYYPVRQAKRLNGRLEGPAD